jgi:hypothetical protein
MKTRSYTSKTRLIKFLSDPSTLICNWNFSKDTFTIEDFPGFDKKGPLGFANIHILFYRDKKTKITQL